MTRRYVDQARFERLDKRRAELKAAARAMEEELIRVAHSPLPHLNHSEIEAEKTRLRHLRSTYRHESLAVDNEIDELAVVEDDEGEDDS